MWEQRRKTKKPGDNNGNGFDSDALDDMPDVDAALAEAEALMQEAAREEARQVAEAKAKAEEQAQVEERSTWGRCRC